MQLYYTITQLTNKVRWQKAGGADKVMLALRWGESLSHGQSSMQAEGDMAQKHKISDHVWNEGMHAAEV